MSIMACSTPTNKTRTNYNHPTKERTMTNVNSELLSIDKQIEALQAERDKVAGKAKAIKEVEALAEKLGYSIDELFGNTKAPTKTGRTRAKAKYQNPEKLRQTWSGIGDKPAWIVEFEANGGNLSDIPFGGK